MAGDDAETAIGMVQRCVGQRGAADDEAAQVLPRHQAELDVDIGETEVGVEQQHATPLSRQRVRQGDGEPGLADAALSRGDGDGPRLRHVGTPVSRRAASHAGVIGSSPSAAPGPMPASASASPLPAAASDAAEAPRQIEPRRHQQAGAGGKVGLRLVSGFGRIEAGGQHQHHGRAGGRGERGQLLHLGGVERIAARRIDQHRHAVLRDGSARVRG